MLDEKAMREADERIRRMREQGHLPPTPEEAERIMEDACVPWEWIPVSSNRSEPAERK